MPDPIESKQSKRPIATQLGWTVFTLGFALALGLIVTYTKLDVKTVFSWQILSLLAVAFFGEEVRQLIGRVKKISKDGLEIFDSQVTQRTPATVTPQTLPPTSTPKTSPTSAPTLLTAAALTTMAVPTPSGPLPGAIDNPITEAGWAEIYKRNHNLFLAHTIKPSKHPLMRYDLTIFVMSEPTEPSQLPNIKLAEFYLGEDWGRDPIRVEPRSGQSIGFNTTAYGEILCTCKVTLTDGTKIYLDRWIDFQMGYVFGDQDKTLFANENTILNG